MLLAMSIVGALNVSIEAIPIRKTQTPSPVYIE
jgi:hypothetical protein